VAIYPVYILLLHKHAFTPAKFIQNCMFCVALHTKKSCFGFIGRRKIRHYVSDLFYVIIETDRMLVMSTCTSFNNGRMIVVR